MVNFKTVSVTVLLTMIAIWVHLPVIGLIYYSVNPKVTEFHLEQYEIARNGYVPERGYVPDSKTAVIIAKGVLASALKKPVVGGGFEVQYDAKNEVWLVHNYHPFSTSGYVVIQKTDGKILRAWLSK